MWVCCSGSPRPRSSLKSGSARANARQPSGFSKQMPGRKPLAKSFWLPSTGHDLPRHQCAGWAFFRSAMVAIIKSLTAIAAECRCKDPGALFLRGVLCKQCTTPQVRQVTTAIGTSWCGGVLKRDQSMFPKSPWLALAVITPTLWGKVPQSGGKASKMPRRSAPIWEFIKTI